MTEPQPNSASSQEKNAIQWESLSFDAIVMSLNKTINTIDDAEKSPRIFIDACVYQFNGCGLTKEQVIIGLSVLKDKLGERDREKVASALWQEISTFLLGVNFVSE